MRDGFEDVFMPEISCLYQFSGLTLLNAHSKTKHKKSPNIDERAQTLLSLIL